MARRSAAATYWKNVGTAIKTLSSGLKLTLRHMVSARKKRKTLAVRHSGYFGLQQEGIATIQYPHESIPVPDTGRYQLHNEMDDCIVCDKCVKICPVNCITIEPVRAVEEFGKTSDGTPKRIYAAKFDIDMGKCCFCGLCTTVCPTECLTMTKSYDYSVFDIREHNFEFANLSAVEIEEKKAAWALYQKNKAEAVEKTRKDDVETPTAPPPGPARAVFKPRIKPAPGKDDSHN